MQRIEKIISPNNPKMAELKRYYSISEVAKIFNVNESLLRYWEKEFANIKPHKTKSGVRQYTQSDIDEIRTVHNLLKVRGMKIATARDVLAKNKQGVSNTTQILDELQSLKSELIALRNELNDLV